MGQDQVLRHLENLAYTAHKIIRRYQKRIGIGNLGPSLALGSKNLIERLLAVHFLDEDSRSARIRPMNDLEQAKAAYDLLFSKRTRKPYVNRPGYKVEYAPNGLEQLEANCQRRGIEVLQTPCFLWQGSFNPNSGHGYFYFEGQTSHVHLVMFKMLGRECAEGELLDQLCGVKLCFRREHLQAVEAAEFYRRIDRRNSWGSRNGHFREYYKSGQWLKHLNPSPDNQAK